MIHHWTVSAGLVVAGIIGFSASAQSADDHPASRLVPNVLLLTVDTLRPDALGFIGGVNETPTIDRLAAEGRAFAAGVTPIPLTLPAHTTIMTGLDPPLHGVHDNGRTVSFDLVTLAEILSDGGWSTAAFVGGFPLERVFGLDQGFDHYDDHFTEGQEGWLERRAADTSDAAADWIQQAREPWFVWVHYYDPHDPYEPPRSFWQPGSRGAYLGEVAYTDFALERLIGALPETSRERLTVFTADHGEALGEHNEKRHGFFVYDSTVTVPMIFHWPGRIPPVRDSGAARLADVMPSLLGLLDLPVPRDIDGQSMAPAIVGDNAIVPTPAYVETQLPWIYYGWAPLEGVRTTRWKYIDAPTPELYDLSADSSERMNLYLKEVETSRRLKQLLESLGGGRSQPAETAEVDEDSLAALRALGYVGAGEEPPSSVAALADPKDRVGLRDRLQDAEDLMKRGDYVAAVRLFDAVLKEEPDNRSAILRSGVALLKSGRPEAALPRLERSIELDPDRAEARFALADALMRVGRFDDAATSWQEAARMQPRRFQVSFNLGVALAEAGRYGEAVAAYQRCRDLKPEAVEAEMAFARSARRAGMAGAAVEVLLAVATRPGRDIDFAEATELGLGLLALGRLDEAQIWLQRGFESGRESAQAAVGLARLAVRNGSNIEACRYLAEALALDATLGESVTVDDELSVCSE